MWIMYSLIVFFCSILNRFPIPLVTDLKTRYKQYDLGSEEDGQLCRVAEHRSLSDYLLNSEKPQEHLVKCKPMYFRSQRDYDIELSFKLYS